MNQFISILKEKHSSKATRRTTAMASAPTTSYQSSRRPRPRVSTEAVGGSSVRAPTHISRQSAAPPESVHHTMASVRTTVSSRKTNATGLQAVPTEVAENVTTSLQAVPTENVTSLKAAPWKETANNFTNSKKSFL